MNKFYLFLWLKWTTRLTISSVTLAMFFSAITTLYMYFSQGMPSFNSEIMLALFDVFKFWFPLFWSLTLLISLFRGLKYIFNNSINGYEFKLLECFSEAEDSSSLKIIEFIGYGDLVKVWRRWFMLIIWLVGAQMIFALVITYTFSSYNGVFEWFNIYWLYGFILVSGYFSFILLGSRCKRVKVKKC